MKIDQQNVQQNRGAGGAQQSGGAQQISGGKGTYSSRGYGLGSDSVQLSSLSAAVRAYTTESPDRASSLQQLGQDVQTGRYQIDAQAVSQGIINDAFLP
ncbi:MAG TPA: flagellar biosynthesis anti-sigma factor FlgM [Bryobacteraceae bacterium]|jgi:flagellar biosynthesis anti-sigma factor FlgM